MTTIYFNKLDIFQNKSSLLFCISSRGHLIIIRIKQMKPFFVSFTYWMLIIYTYYRKKCFREVVNRKFPDLCIIQHVTCHSRRTSALETCSVFDLRLRVAYVTERQRRTEARAPEDVDVNRRETKMASVCQHQCCCVNVYRHVFVGILLLGQRCYTSVDSLTATAKSVQYTDQWQLECLQF